MKKLFTTLGNKIKSYRQRGTSRTLNRIFVMNNYLKYGFSSKYVERRHIKNPSEQVYYIIRRRPLWAGFFSNFYYVLAHLQYGHENGWKCVVDMQNYPSHYSQKKKIFNTKNAWLYYYKQPDGVSLQQAYSSKNYVLSANKYLEKYNVPSASINNGIMTNDMIRILYPLQQKLLVFNDNIQHEADNYFSQNMRGKKWIGAHVRGTDMKNPGPGHYLQPTPGGVMQEIDAILEQNPDAGIFLCCDEQSTIEQFKKKYNNRCLYLDAYRSQGGLYNGIHKQSATRKNHHYLLGKEVLLDCLLLSKCNFLICGVSNVGNAAILLNNMQYDNVKIFNAQKFINLQNCDAI